MAGEVATTGTSGLAGALPFVGAGLGVLQAGLGIIQGIGAKKRINGLLDQRKAYQTPDQIYDILNATLNNAQGDTITRDYQTDQINQGLSNSLGAATRLGANPNDLSSIFQNSVSGIMQAGQQFHQSNTQAFSNVINAFKLVAENKDAEYASQQDIIKDKLAAQGANLQASGANTSGGLNTILSSLSSKATGDLFKQNSAKQTDAMAQMLNDFLYKKQVTQQVGGAITGQDMFLSQVSNPILTATG